MENCWFVCPQGSKVVWEFWNDREMVKQEYKVKQEKQDTKHYMQMTSIL